MRFRVFSLLAGTALACSLMQSEPLQISRRKIHLRSGEKREWSSFPAAAQGKSISLEFAAEANPAEYTLVLRQRDVKNTTWSVLLNGRKLGVLQDDERNMLRALAVPPNTLRTGSNTLEITGGPGPVSDDIEISDVRLEPVPLASLLSQTTLSVEVTGDGPPMPVRLTVVDANGFLVPLSTLRSGVHEAVRTGVLYTADGKARIGLPAGEYRVYASRGFEYSAPSEQVRLEKGATRQSRLRIRREVNIPGFISCDTHVHTREFSGHGDATVDERVLTAAGEGLDTVIVTEHNRVSDYTPALQKSGLDRWLIAVPGNEVTTRQGHFNIFPARPESPQPDPREEDWSGLMSSLAKTDAVRVVVQNHPRDLHSDYRPFDPSHHLSSIGLNLELRPFRANAMEVVNSGAMSSDPLQLVRDWMGLLTRGIPVAAIGASDTHTVDFVPIGQARTYINTAALPGPWRENVDSVFRSLAGGRNLVSYGLAAQLQQASPARPAAKGIEVDVDLRIYGPSWSAADRVTIFSNGLPVWEDSFAPVKTPGLKLRRRVTLTLPKHDATLVALVTGPGTMEPFWEVRKPYQPTQDTWTPLNLGVSEAVWVDGDGDRTPASPLAIAQKLVEQTKSNLPALVRTLAACDASVTMHVLELLRETGVPPQAMRSFLQTNAPAVRQGADQYFRELRQIKLER